MNTQPFSEDEKRFVLAEAIRTSAIPVDRIFALLNENYSVPAWDDMLLPRGRNLKQCKDAFESLRVNPPAPNFQSHFQGQSQVQSHSLSVTSLSAPSSSIKRKTAPGTVETFSSGPPTKRRQPSNDPVSTTRDILPKPSNGSPLSVPSFPTPEPKKRGRPTKKDQERKQQLAIARGEVIPPTPLMTAYQGPGEDGSGSGSGYPPILPAVAPSFSYTPSPGIPIEREPPESAGSLGKKRRPRVTPQAPKATPQQSGETSFQVNPAILPITEPERPHATTPMAISEIVPATISVDRASPVPRSLPIVSAAPHPPTPTTPTTQPTPNE